MAYFIAVYPDGQEAPWIAKSPEIDMEVNAIKPNRDGDCKQTLWRIVEISEDKSKVWLEEVK